MTKRKIQIEVVPQTKAPTEQLRPIAPPRRPRGDISSIAAAVARRSGALDQTVANTIATQLYNTSESFPQLSLLEAWKDDRLDCPAWFILAVLKAYAVLVQRHGGRPGE